MSNNEEEIEYDSASATSLDSNFNEKDGEFLAPLVVPQQPLISSQQQSNLSPRLFHSGRDEMRWNIYPSSLPAIIPNMIHQRVCIPKGQTTETEIESWELFFDSAMLESITDFTNIKICLLCYLFLCDGDAKETYIIEIHALFGLLYMAGMIWASHIVMGLLVH